jgi:peptidoglycan/LPS O-acetylase OafA/YrhL
MTTAASKGLRQDIQQLRGIAVLAVIINHLGVPWLPGGYLGVDMFFVVSGFVITLSMLSSGSSPESRTHFFVHFWIRRMFRLWPMLFVTVIATTTVLLVTGLANPDSLLTGLTSVLALSNFRLLFGRLEYFALDTGADWFMHTWSLAVEEQIYVALSVVFTVVGVGRTANAAPRRLRRLLVVVAVLVSASLVLAFLPITSEVVRFYAPHTRFYQVGAGAMIALIFARRSISSVALPHKLRSSLLLLSSVGLAALFVFNPWSGRVISLVATLLTVLVIVIASAEHQSGGFIRGGWLGYIGDRSYALYLVHWPVQLLAEAVIDEGYARHSASLVLTLVLGVSGYHFVENRSRHYWKSLRRRHAGAIALTALLITFGVTGFAFNRSERIARSATVEIPPERCTREDASIWVIGDSHLGAISPEIAQAFEGDCAIVGSYGVILDFADLERSATGQRSLRIKLPPVSWLVNQIKNAESPPRALIVVHFLSAFLSDPTSAPPSADFVATEWHDENVSRKKFIEMFADNMRQLAGVMAEHGGALVVTSPPPDFNWLRVELDPAQCTSRIVVSRECSISRTEARLSIPEHEARGGEVRALLNQLQREVPNFVHIALDAPLCNNNYCSNFSNGKPLYIDDDHLNFDGARMIGHLFDQLTPRLQSTGIEGIRCFDRQSVYRCRIVEQGGLLGEYQITPKFVDIPSADEAFERLTLVDNYNQEYCISYWGEREVSFAPGRCDDN